MTLWPQIPGAPRCPICGAEACYADPLLLQYRCRCTPMCIEFGSDVDLWHLRNRSAFESYRRLRCNQGYGWSWFPESRPSV